MKSPNPNVTVTTEVDYCPFCRRSRTLRREERHLGGLVRTMVSCETCHQTLSSTMGPAVEAVVEAVEATEAPSEPAAAVEPEAKPAPKPARKPAATTTKKPAAKKTTKPAATKKAAPKKKA